MLLFCRRHLRLRQMGKGVEVGALQLLATPVVDHQATGDGAQERARGVQLDALGSEQYAQEGVLGQVRGIGGIAQPAAKPVVQPAVMVAVERLDVEGRGHGRAKGCK